jgi:hypothetical protein
MHSASAAKFLAHITIHPHPVAALHGSPNVLLSVVCAASAGPQHLGG